MQAAGRLPEEREMTPYYETDLGKLYHGDCLEIMPLLEPVDLVLTDPPYVGLKEANFEYMSGGVSRIRRNNSKPIGDPWKANLDWVYDAERLALNGMIVFCSFHFISKLEGAVKKSR